MLLLFVEKRCLQGNLKKEFKSVYEFFSDFYFNLFFKISKWHFNCKICFYRGDLMKLHSNTEVKKSNMKKNIHLISILML